MDWHAWVTVAVIVALVGAMVREVAPPAAVVLSATVVLLLLGVIDGDQAFAGFSNEAPIVVGALLIFARAVDVTGAIQPVVQSLFGTSRSPRVLLTRLLFPVTGASGFLNNTTLVAMTVPAVLDLCQRLRLNPSRFLIPVSYAAILGGVMTAIGTSTNLTVSGLLIRAGMRPLGLFELTPLGLPVALAGTAALVILAPILLPDRGSRRERFDAQVRDFTVSMRVERGGPIAGKPVDEAGLRQLEGVFLVEIERGGRSIAPVAPEEVLEGDDLLTFAGRVGQVVDLQRMRGLRWAEAKHIDALTGGGKEFYEVVVGPGLGGSAHTLKSVGFRARYGAAVLAMYRADQRIDAKLGDIPLRLGDTLLVLADAAFRHRWREGGDFLLLAPIRGVLPHQRRKAWVVGLLGAAFIAVTGLNLVPILQGSLALVLLLVVTRVLTVRQAREAVDLNIVVLIAAGIGLGAAVQSTGLAVAAADGLVTIFRPFGNVGALAGVIVSTLILTELVGHNAAAVLLFPIAVATAAVTGSDPRPFVIGVAMGASLSFLSPLGYQTNLMVYALGGYRFTDFTRIGLPITTICFILELLLIPVIFPF